MIFVCFAPFGLLCGLLIAGLWHSAHLVFGIPPVADEAIRGLALGGLCLSQVVAGALALVP